MTGKQSQTSGDSSINVQSGGDTNITQNSVVLYSIEEVSKKLLESAFGELPDATKSDIKSNQKSYFESLSDKLREINKQAGDVKKIIESPDFQYISKKATISASRSSSEELHGNLAALIVNRINHDHEALKRIIYNEAIDAIEKLTHDQLQILSTGFILTRTKLEGVNSVAQFKQFLDQRVKPFLCFKNTITEFQHLVYVGCANIGLLNVDLKKLFVKNYPNIFMESDDIFEVLKDNSTAMQLKALASATPITRLELTPVGIVIAATHLEQVTRDKLNMDIWIN